MASQTITGQDLQYTQDNLRCYAYSGDITDAGSGSAATTLLDFTSGAGIIVARFNWVAAVNANTDIYLDLLFNSESVYKGYSDQEPSFIADREFKIIIPPFTHLVFNMGFSATKNMCMVMTGRVFDYLPVRN